MLRFLFRPFCWIYGHSWMIQEITDRSKDLKRLCTRCNKTENWNVNYQRWDT